LSDQKEPAVGIVTVSDRARRGDYEDRSGPAVEAYLREVLEGPWRPITRIVSDDEPEIRAALLSLCDEEACSLVITTGGTGPGPRDVTPEVTAALSEKLLPGLGERMRAVSVATVPTAILSRQTAGVRGRTLIVNLPGSPKAVAECLDAVFPAVADCLDVIGAAPLATNDRRFTSRSRHRGEA
jgi:molybdopterin adenylyltransferase